MVNKKPGTTYIAAKSILASLVRNQVDYFGPVSYNRTMVVVGMNSIMDGEKYKDNKDVISLFSGGHGIEYRLWKGWIERGDWAEL